MNRSFMPKRKSFAKALTSVRKSGKRDVSYTIRVAWGRQCGPIKYIGPCKVLRFRSGNIEVK